MKVDFTYESRKLENALYRLSQEARVAPGVIIKEETKQLVRNIMQLTPPKNLAQGRNAVKRDLRKIAIPIGADFADNETLTVEGIDGSWRAGLARAIRKRSVTGIEAMLSVSKSKFWRNRKVVPDAATLASSHKNNRNIRGRTYTMRQLAFQKDWKGHLKNIQSRVGWVKSGWVAAGDACGLATPGWLRRLAAVSGRATANFGPNPRVYAVNYNVKIPNYQQIVSAALRNRVRVTETKILRLIQGKAVNLGFMRVDAR